MMIDYALEIKKLKAERNAVILAHYYTEAQVQEIADFVGDSLALSQKAATTEAEVILFAGVHFMAETAKVLSPDKVVLIPDLEAGCSLADSCGEQEFARFKKEHPGYLVISYVNTTVGVKALTDICCTSSNALQIVESLPKEQNIIFAPDRNLGAYIKRITGRENIILWDGACHVHEEFSLEKILELKKLHPGAKVLSHPECKAPILLISDFVGSTAAILNFCTKDSAREYIVVTESGILHQMRKSNPDKTFIPAPPIDSTCGCNNCSYMKLMTLPKIYAALRDMSPQVTVPLEQIPSAAAAINAMLKLSK